MNPPKVNKEIIASNNRKQYTTYQRKSHDHRVIFVQSLLCVQ